MSKQINSSQTFNTEQHLKDLNDRFNRMVKNLGVNNKIGSDRYECEVNFAYTLNEFKHAPEYMKGKIFDKASAILGKLIGTIKNNNATIVTE